MHGREDVASKLIAKGANLDAVDANGDSVLIVACREDHSELALQLIDKVDVNIQNKEVEGSTTALHYACEKGWQDVMSKLIAKGAKVDTVDANGDSALILACKEGHSKIALQLIDKADVNIQEDGNTALHLACEQGWEDVVSKLIAKGAKVDAVNANGNSPLNRSL